MIFLSISVLLKSKHKVVSKSYLFKVILERYQVSAYEFENTAVYFIREYETKTVSAASANENQSLNAYLFLWWWVLPEGLWRHYNLIVWMTLIIPRRCFPTIIKFPVVSDLKAIRHLALCLQMNFKPFTVDIVSKFDTIWWIFYWQLLQNQIIVFVFKYYQFVLWGINFSVILIL